MFKTSTQFDDNLKTSWRNHLRPTRKSFSNKKSKLNRRHVLSLSSTAQFECNSNAVLAQFQKNTPHKQSQYTNALIVTLFVVLKLFHARSNFILTWKQVEGITRVHSANIFQIKEKVEQVTCVVSVLHCPVWMQFEYRFIRFPKKTPQRISILKWFNC